jgi:hypothetical protein
MLEALLLVKANGTAREKLGSVSLANAKQLIIGRFVEDGAVVHLASDTNANLQRAIGEFAGLAGVTSVYTLAVEQRS